MTSLLTMKFHESCKYVLRTKHNFLALPFFVSERALKSLPPQWREVVLQAARDTCAEQVDSAIQLDLDNESVLKSTHHVTVFEFSPEDAAQARALCEPVLNANAKRIGMTKEWQQIREIARMLKEGDRTP